MAYARFILPSTPAKVANPATVGSAQGQTIVELASVAAVHLQNQFSETPSVAIFAEKLLQPEDEVFTARAEQYEVQADPNRCHVCGEREAADAPFIAVLTSQPGIHHWLHSTCHPEHIRRCLAVREAAGR